jgi:glycosyltransferase involved in cell wall biosynthesis
MANRAILLINYDFPPGLTGVRRIVKFAKFLPEFGYAPIVLAAQPDPRMPLDLEALREVEAQGYPVVRTRSMDAYQLWSWLRRARSAPGVERGTPLKPPSRASRAVAGLLRKALIPDDRIGWYRYAVRAGCRVLEESKADVILTSSYPNTAHLVGRSLKRKYGVKWIADFRDSWTTNPYIGVDFTPIHAAANRRLERSVAREADALVTVSDPIAAHLAEIRGSGTKVHVIPNGYDDEDLRGIEPQRFDRFTFAYTGTLFPPRTPEPLFAALRSLIDAEPALASGVQVCFMSRLRPDHTALIARYGLSDVVGVRPLGTHREALRLQASADALFTIDARTENADTMLTQKVFEYLAAAKPILAVAPEGALGDLVRSTGRGLVVPPDDIPAIASAIRRIMQNPAAFHGKPQSIARYHRRELTRQLACVIDGLLE